MPDETTFDATSEDHIVVQIIVPRKGGRMVGGTIVEFTGGVRGERIMSVSQAMAFLAEQVGKHLMEIALSEPQMQRIATARGPVMKA